MNNLTVTFFSNFLLHHQTPFCEAMIDRIGDGFRFVATEPTPQERIDLGYKNLEDVSYVINSHKDEASYKEAMRLGYDSDIVIIGSASDDFIQKRLSDNKLTFRYNERFFKKFWSKFHPRVLLFRYKRDFLNRNKNLHMLCASAYTAGDCKWVFSYPNKTYKWGYFPEIEAYENIDEIISNKKKHSLLWVGRLIEWKHPEQAVQMAKMLKSSGIEFELNIIGIGPMYKQLKDMITALDLDDCVHMLGAMSPENVRTYMEKAEIFLFTSDRNEGWGAVLNESMSAACVVVACEEIGSVPYLITHGVNGYVYSRKKKRSLYEYVKVLLENDALRKRMQMNAYETIHDVWNAETAVDRFLYLVECIKQGKETGYESGPCSRD